ncbi:MAG TPA: cupredoxin family copper-binding protein [Gemmatimonadaceae bacterium]|nr:cupredoxin family copper-binding protein [Gemmatimonadaceae bacterium]
MSGGGRVIGPSRAAAVGATLSGTIAVALVAAALLMALVSCVSERATGTRDVAAGACTAQLPADAFGSTVVVIRDFAFTPAQVRVRPGTKVTWVNCDAAGQPSHTSSADGGAWRSPLLAPGESYTQTFDAAGDFPYHCDPHPFMTARVTVE